MNAEFDLAKISTSLDFMKLLLGKKIKIKCKSNRTLYGNLEAYDEHLNLLISDAKEEYMENDKKNIRKLDTLFFRGDLVVFVSPILKQ